MGPLRFRAAGRKKATKPGLKLFHFILSYSIFVFLMHGYFAL